MKLELIDLVDFGSHRETHWDPGDARLCVLVGPMGAGKSTLIEGIRHALYKDDRSSIDGVVRTGATDSAVTIEYSFAGNRYRAIRRRSIRAGGKSSADLQIQGPEGSWSPVASGDKEVPAAVRELLRMDAATFRSSVMLAQGDLKRFVQATPGKGSPTEPGRAAILSTIVVDPRFARAEVEGRARATKLEASIAADRGQVERLVDAIAEFDRVEDNLAEAQNAVAAATSEIASANEARGAAETRLRELAAEMATGSAAEGDVARLEAERTTLADRYRREQKTIADAAAAAESARVLIADAGDVDVAVEDLATMRLEVANLERVEADDRRLGIEARDLREAIAREERPHVEARATWTAQRDAARTRVTELIEHGKAGSAVCQTCGQTIGREETIKQLAAARAKVKALEEAEPKVPLSVDRQRAALVRIDERLRELDWDPGILNEARRQLAELERRASRGEAVAVAQTNLEASQSAAADATAELARITAAGEVLAEQLAAARTKVAGLATVRARQAAAEQEIRALAAKVEAAEALRRVAEQSVARAEANLERRQQLQAERDALVDGLAASEVAIARIHKMVKALGVKGIPARIVERVLPELGRYANDMLGQLVPGASVEIRPQRASSDGKGVIESIDLVYRDADGERAMDRPSGGETTAVSLALAIGLNRLNARRSGSAIRLLVVDEPDGLDVPGRRAFGEALRRLAHSGELERVVLITHTPDLVDYADGVWEFTKNGRGTVVEQVA
jgi:DNA repair exonuclease SbcCD ATPase subunit